MTQSDPNQLSGEIRASLTNLTSTVEKLERTVEGDAGMGVPSLRTAIRNVADELKNEAESLCERLDELERARQAQENYLKGITAVGKFLGVTSLAGVVGLIAQLAGWVGGK